MKNHGLMKTVKIIKAEKQEFIKTEKTNLIRTEKPKPYKG